MSGRPKEPKEPRHRGREMKSNALLFKSENYLLVDQIFEIQDRRGRIINFSPPFSPSFPFLFFFLLLFSSGIRHTACVIRHHDRSIPIRISSCFLFLISYFFVSLLISLNLLHCHCMLPQTSVFAFCLICDF